MKKILISFYLIFVSAISYSQWVQLNSGTTDQLNSVFFTNLNTGYAVGENGTILKTINGGTVWFPQTSGSTLSLRSVFFSSPDTGYIVGCDFNVDTNIILKTTNGGTIWEPQTSGVLGGLYSVFFTSNDNGYAVGGTADLNKTILKTINGGINWVIQANLLNAAPLMSVSFFSNSIGCAVGLDKTIIWTEDGGINWVLLPAHPLIDPNKQFNSVCFTDTTSFCVVGQTGTILTGYGNTYQTSPTSNWLTSVFFTSPDTGYIGGDGGHILKTIDGGTMWTPQFTNTIEGINSIFFIYPDTGYAVGYNGCVLKTTNGGSVGLENENLRNKVKVRVFPNPVKNGVLFIESETASNTKVEIYGIDGILKSEVFLAPETRKIDVSTLNKGMYVIKFINTNICYQKKIVIN